MKQLLSSFHAFTVLYVGSFYFYYDVHSLATTFGPTGWYQIQSKRCIEENHWNKQNIYKCEGPRCISIGLLPLLMTASTHNTRPFLICKFYAYAFLKMFHSPPIRLITNDLHECIKDSTAEYSPSFTHHISFIKGSLQNETQLHKQPRRACVDMLKLTNNPNAAIMYHPAP